jgi:hypothetical protein
VAWVTKFLDDFDNATVDVSTDAGNGSVTEPAGTSLVMSITAGNHAGWGGGTGNDNEGAPIAYEELGPILSQWDGLLRFETKQTNFTKTGNEIFSGLTVWDDRDNAYTIGWYDANDDVYIYKIVDDVGRTNIWQAGNYGHPNTSPHIYRFYINLTNKRVGLEEGGKLNPKSIGFVFSSNNGSSWVYAHQRELEILPNRFGVYALNWASYWRGCDVSYDYLKVEQDLSPLSVEMGEADAGEGTAQKALLEDGARRITSGGAPSHHGLSHGIRMPGPVDQQNDDFDRVPKTMVEDRVLRTTHIEPEVEASQVDKGLLEDRHGDLRMTGPEALTSPEALAQDYGLHHDSQRTFIEDQLRAKIADVDYIAEKEDGDSNELLGAVETRDVVKIDTTIGGFGDPTSNNHWGAARDGKFYADGVECSPGTFGTLAGGFDHEHWRNSEEEPFKMSTGNGSMSMFADDTPRLTMTTASGWPGGPGFNSWKKWLLTAGDFDIQLDFANGSWNHADHALQFGISYNPGGAEGNNSVYVGRTRNRYEFMRLSNGAWAAVATGGSADASGKFRLTRVSGVYHAYYWTGSWVELGAGYTHPLGDLPVAVWVDVNGTSSVTLSFDISNFTIASGSTSNRAGWYRESSGAHRGTQQDMPNTLGVVSTIASLDLIDLTNDKLWMRFVRGSLNALNAYQNERPRRAVWDDGQLILAYGSGPNETQEGGAVVVDFTMDTMRYHREAASTICGGWYRGAFARNTGLIALRNGGYAFSVDDDDWGIPDYRVWDAALWRDSGYEYRAIATVEGLGVFKWQRWYMQNSPDIENSVSTEVTHMHWCLFDPTSGELFYMDDATMHSVAKTGAGGWETVMDGGSFTAATTKTLPGSRHTPQQYSAIRYGSYLFMPAVDGIYRIDWPSGSWTLFYGKAGSGATHEILPDYGTILSIAFGNDGTYDLLVVGLRNSRWGGGQVAAVKLTDNTLYGVTPVRALEEPRAIGA